MFVKPENRRRVDEALSIAGYRPISAPATCAGAQRAPPTRGVGAPATSSATGRLGRGPAVNYCLHTMAITQIRHDTRERAYYRWKRVGGKERQSTDRGSGVLADPEVQVAPGPVLGAEVTRAVEGQP